MKNITATYACKKHTSPIILPVNNAPTTGSTISSYAKITMRLLSQSRGTRNHSIGVQELSSFISFFYWAYRFFINHFVFLLIFSSRECFPLAVSLSCSKKFKIINENPANHKSELIEMRGCLWYNFIVNNDSN